MFNETYDYALARYRTDTDCESAYRACADGSVRGYVSDFAASLSVNELHFKVGLTTGCTTGNLLGVGSTTAGGITRRGQLLFQRMTQPGDSGSIVVHEKSNRLVGLHFAGFDHPTDPSLSRSYSNPIYLAGFRLIGHYEFLNGARVPIYDAANARVPVTPESSQGLAHPEVEKNTFDKSINPVIEVIGCQLFLGSWRKGIDHRGQYLSTLPDPLPVSGGAVTQVEVDRVEGYQGRMGWVNGSATILFFG